MYQPISQIKLRPYQEDAISGLRHAYRQGRRAPCYVLPTGGGKSLVFCTIARSAIEKGNRVFILVHRQELIRQTCDTLNELQVPHGVIAANHTMTTEKIQVCSVQTLVRRLPKFRAHPALIILDEFHHARAGMWETIVNHFSGSRFMGCTATPIRTDNRGLGMNAGGICDCLIEGPNIAELISEGYLSPVSVYAPPGGVNLDGVHRKFGDFDKKEVAARMDKPKIVGNAVQHYLKICPHKPAICFTISIKFAERMAEEFRQAGVPAASIDGKLTAFERQKRMDDLQSGAIKVLTSCELISEGVDCPKVACAILLRPTQSLGLYLQQVGRALRPYPGKERAIVLDHVGNSSRHGMPDDIRSWSLESGEVSSKKASEKLDPIRVCQKCFLVYKAILDRCPHCGAVYQLTPREIQEVEGELQEVQKRYEWRVQRREQGSAQSLEQLAAIGKARGYRSPKFWAMKVLEGRKKKVALKEGKEIW